MIAKIKEFVGEVSKEMKKVSWPTKEQLKESTIVVITASLVMTVFVYAIDFVMGHAIKLIF
jgi:preprotein translocase subunit SecE